MKGAPTMDDVARAARCSRAAVSLALRGDRSISEKTRQRIIASAQRVGYRVNPLVAALMSLHRRRRRASAATSVIAFLTSHPPAEPWRRHSSYVGMFDGACERAQEIGYRVEEFNLAALGMTPARMRRILLARNVHGVVVAPLPHREVRIDFDFSAAAVVGLGMSVHEPVIERIANDHFQSAALAVEKCVGLGYRRIGLALSQETSFRLDHRWLAGFRFGVAQHALAEIVPPLMTERSEELPAAIPGWQREHQPDVVILDNSYPAYVRQVPAAIGVVSLTVDRPDDRVSGIFQNYALLGRVAVEHVAAKLYTNSFGELDEAHLHLVAGRWVAGATTPGPGRRRKQALE